LQSFVGSDIISLAVTLIALKRRLLQAKVMQVISWSEGQVQGNWRQVTVPKTIRRDPEMTCEKPELKGFWCASKNRTHPAAWEITSDIYKKQDHRNPYILLPYK